jgi:hypothetical protein
LVVCLTGLSCFHLFAVWSLGTEAVGEGLGLS